MKTRLLRKLRNEAMRRVKMLSVGPNKYGIFEYSFVTDNYQFSSDYDGTALSYEIGLKNLKETRRLYIKRRLRLMWLERAENGFCNKRIRDL